MTLVLLPLLALVGCLVDFEADARLIDLSHVHGPNTFMTPGNRAYNRTQTFRGEVAPGVMGVMGEFFTGEHGGTHVDAPNHVGVVAFFLFQIPELQVKGNLAYSYNDDIDDCKFLHGTSGFSDEGVLTLDQIPLENTIAEGVMIDCSTEASKDRKYLATVQKILDWEKEHGQIPPRAAVIFSFDWSKWYDNRTLYVDSEEPVMSTFTFPAVSKEAGVFLYEQRQIKIIATDTMSPDPLSSNGQHVMSFPIHELYLPNNVLIVESLNGTERLPSRGFRFHATPVKYLGATGAQVRAYAMTYEGSSSGGEKTGLTFLMVLALPIVNIFISF